jgi:hypothetical protein
MEVFMHRVATVVFLALVAIALWAAAALANRQGSAPTASVYDPDPSHLWNRLYAALLVRQDRNGTSHGADSLDPLLWAETEHLLAEPSHAQAMQLLDEFLRTHGETLIRDPLKHALLEHDLWAVFDWSISQFSVNGHPQYDKQKHELQQRLAELLRRVAPSDEEIKSLPDNYAHAVGSGAFAAAYDPEHRERPFLPPDLFLPRGPWVCLTPSPESDNGVAPMHLFSVSGRSGFFVFIRLPEGRVATYDYLQKLWDFPTPYVRGSGPGEDQAPLNPDLPSFPAGTQVALVRRMMLFDRQGSLTATSIVESVQVRVYHLIGNAEERNFGGGNLSDILRNSGQDFYEFKLSRPMLFAGKNGGLRAIGPEASDFSTFQTKGGDEFESSDSRQPIDKPFPELQRCVWCHNGGGVRSLNSRPAVLKPNRRQQEPRSIEYGPIYWGDGAAVDWKSNRFDWGLLNGYWRTSPPQ